MARVYWHRTQEQPWRMCPEVITVLYSRLGFVMDLTAYYMIGALLIPQNKVLDVFIIV